MSKGICFLNFKKPIFQVLLVTRPRRWGKSTLLSMVQTFFDINRLPTEIEEIKNLFAKLKIGTDQKYLSHVGTFPVILLTLSWKSEDFMHFFEETIGNLFLDQQHLYDELLKKKMNGGQNDKVLLSKIANYEILMGVGERKPNVGELVKSLTFLVELTHDHFKKKVIILIDEVDFPILNFIEQNIESFNENFPKSEIRQNLLKISNLLGDLISPLVKPGRKMFSDKIELVLVTGITDSLVRMESSPLNMIKTFTITDSSFQEFYGATDEDIKELMQRIFKEIDSITEKHILADIKSWYNGYRCPFDSKISIYNVYSIINYFYDFVNHYRNKKDPIPFKPKSYWITSSINMILANFNLIRNLDKKFLETLFELTCDKNIDHDYGFAPNDNDFSLFLKGETNFQECLPYLLLHTGYVAMDQYFDEKIYYRVPNNEIRKLLSEYILPSYVASQMSLPMTKKNFVDVSKKLSDELQFDDLFQGNVQDFVLNSMTNSGKINEITFESIIFSLIFWHFLQYPSSSFHKPLIEKSVRGGKIDTIIEPNHDNNKIFDYMVMIHEYKSLDETNMNNVEDAQKQAYWQIFCKNYLSEPLSKYPYLDEKYKESWKVKLRTIIFHRDENKNKWLMTMKCFVFTYGEASKIFIFFEKKISNIRFLLADKNNEKLMKNQRDVLLKYYQEKNVYELIDMLKNKSETEIQNFPKEMEINASKNKRDNKNQNNEPELDPEKRKHLN